MIQKFSSKLLNYVEPYEYNYSILTAFYSEVNTNFSVGDKVFIINGNYDSNSLIDDTYSLHIDGYNVVFVDRCKIVLDINYSNISVKNTETLDNFIIIHSITTQREFDYINSINVNSYTYSINKFEYGLTNNFIYAATAFSGTTSVLLQNNGVTQSGLYQRNNINWVNVTNDFLLGTFSFSASYSLINNGKIIIKDNDINDTLFFKKNNIYNFTDNWIPDVTHYDSYISISNFRDGEFLGTWYDGVFGSYDKRIYWNNTNPWYNGVFLNADWLNGVITSKTDNNKILNTLNMGLHNPVFNVVQNTSNDILSHSYTASRTIDFNVNIQQTDNNIINYYYCYLVNNLPVQTTDLSNNKGYGFNFFENSNIISGDIKNGNFMNCTLGTNSIINALDVYYGLSYSYYLNIRKGKYSNSYINSASINNSDLVKSRVYNSNILSTNIHNSYLEKTAFSGTYNIDNGVKINNADLWSYVSNDNTNRGILKLYISEDDYNNINNFDVIYVDNIKKELYLNKFSSDERIYLNYENKYIFDIFKDNSITGTFSDSVIVAIKNKNENLYKTYINKNLGTYSTIYSTNDISSFSIDLDLGQSISYYVENNIKYYNSKITTDIVKNLFSNTILSDSHFDSGIMNNVNWNSGDIFNDVSNIIHKTGNTYSMFIASTNSLVIDVSNKIYNNYDVYNVGEYVWINGLDYVETIAPYNKTNFNARFKVASLTNSVVPNTRRIILTEQTNVINGITYSGQFSIPNVNSNYVSLSKTNIENSTIVSGLFRTPLITNTDITNYSFDNTDKIIVNTNINKLRIINTLFRNDNNIINSGLIYKSHIMNTMWNNGISYNNINYGNTFSNGVFNSGYWYDSTFIKGEFINSNDNFTSSLTYDDSTYFKAWRNGTFTNGQFFNSVWIDGVFNNGLMYNSNWYGGVWNDGVLGVKNLSYEYTTMGHYANLGTGSTFTTWNNGVVNGALIGGSSSVYWNGGAFNNGKITNNVADMIWYDGDFNGGKITGNVKWKNGNFNNGKFLSYYGWTHSNSTMSSDYAWENGNFYSGQFGQQSLATNSVWYDGVFAGGNFYGRVWNDGTFLNGNFNGGSATNSYLNEVNFVNSFTNSYYGLWRKGSVVELLHISKKQQFVSNDNVTNIQRAVNMNNMLWCDGTFSHTNGVFENSVWLSGQFSKGSFNDSSFNPYVDRTLSGSTSSLSFDLSNDCVWYSGSLNNSSFYISRWGNGTFNSGYMQGAVWENGIWYYGAADNIYWKNGTWKNGTWYGTNFDYTTLNANNITDNKTLDILYNIATMSGTNSIHMLNVFTGSSTEVLYDVDFSKEHTLDYNGWTQSTPNGWAWSNNYTNAGFSVIGYNYQNLGSSQSNILYGLRSGYTTSIFTDNVNYSINLSVHLDYGIYHAHTSYFPVALDIYMGNTVSTVYCSGGAQTFTINLSNVDAEFWTNSFTSTKFGISKRASYNNVQIAFLNVSVKETILSYNKIYNNKLYNANVCVTSSVALPGLISLSDNMVSLRFGNGSFVSGIWENGVWNNGYRNDITLTRCELYPISSYVRINKNIHRVQLSVLDADNLNLFNVGDYVSVGNIVGYDVNNVRKLLKDKFKVVAIGNNNIVLEYTINSPLYQIRKDSEYHLIYLSKNIWLSGAFLNGVFKGIWNNGLFKGYPYITYAENIHWIDGNIDGGHINSITQSILNLYTSNVETYNTSLIQNINFKDNNIDTPTNFTYQTWLDLNYTSETQTNIYQDKNYYDSFNDVTLSKANLNGFITYDVLSSNSIFRNGYDFNQKTYKLGVKYTVYTDYLEQVGNFNNLFDNRNSKLGLDNFINDGWSITSQINGVFSSFSYYDSILYPEELKYYNTDGTLNIISTTGSYDAITLGLTAFPSTSVQNYIVLNNSNSKNIPNQRYSVVQYDVLSWTGYPGPIPFSDQSYANSEDRFFPPSINFMITPATYSLSQMVVNPFYNNNVTKKEFFYNKHNLLMEFIGSGGNAISGTGPYPFEINIDNLHFYEIDMIPFFMYTTESNVDNAIRKPWVSSAPFVNYNNANYNFIDNTKINITSQYISSSSSVFNPNNSGSIFNNV